MPCCQAGSHSRLERTVSTRLDRSEPKADHAARRLESDLVAWLTTVASDGTPQTSPIWFLWDGEQFLLYSLESARVRNIERNSRVSLNLDGNGKGGDIVVIEGTARIDRSLPSAADHADYLAKYGPTMETYRWAPEWFAGRYSVPIRITPTKYRYW